MITLETFTNASLIWPSDWSLSARSMVLLLVSCVSQESDDPSTRVESRGAARPEPRFPSVSAGPLPSRAACFIDRVAVSPVRRSSALLRRLGQHGRRVDLHARAVRRRKGDGLHVRALRRRRLELPQ